MSAHLLAFERRLNVKTFFHNELRFSCSLDADKEARPTVVICAGPTHLQFYPPAADLRGMAAALIGLADAVDRRDCVTAPAASDIGARLALEGAL